MKKTPLFFTIPVIAIVIVIAIAFVLKLGPAKPAVTTVPTEFPGAVGETAVKKPESYLGSLFGAGNPTLTPTPATATELSNDLKSTYDDGGASELDAIAKDASSL